MRGIRGMTSQSFLAEPDDGLREKGSVSFNFWGTRKRAAMQKMVAWAEANPPPTLEDVRHKLRDGPGNDPERKMDPFHALCIFHNCADEFCTGLH